MQSWPDHPLSTPASPPRVLNLFCGAGGLAEGFEQAGFQIAAGVDWDPHALATFQRNHPTAVPISGDIREIKSSQLANLGPIDVLAGGPSCQGFSTHGKRIFEDPRNFLFREFARVARDLRPPWLVIENVRGMLTYKKGLFRHSITEAFEEMGYRVESRLVLAADYGVPQLRQRIVFIGTSTDLPIPFPEPTHGSPRPESWVSVGDAISDLPPLGHTGGSGCDDYTSPPSTAYQRWARHTSTRLTLHSARPVSRHALSIIRKIPMGKGIRHIPEDELPERFRRMRTINSGKLRRDCTTLYHRVDVTRPSYTITCYFRNVSAGPFVHPYEDRAFSAREAARLQSFRDTYEFVGSTIPRQIGNAVPPLLAQAIASALYRVISGTPGSLNIHQEARQLAFA